MQWLRKTVQRLTDSGISLIVFLSGSQTETWGLDLIVLNIKTKLHHICCYISISSKIYCETELLKETYECKAATFSRGATDYPDNMGFIKNAKSPSNEWIKIPLIAYMRKTHTGYGFFITRFQMDSLVLRKWSYSPPVSDRVRAWKKERTPGLFDVCPGSQCWLRDIEEGRVPHTQLCVQRQLAWATSLQTFTTEYCLAKWGLHYLIKVKGKEDGNWEAETHDSFRPRAMPRHPHWPCVWAQDVWSRRSEKSFSADAAEKTVGALSFAMSCRWEGSGCLLKSSE